MHIEFQQALNQWISQDSFNLQEASRFSPADFREGVQWLVVNDQEDMAQALADAADVLTPAQRQKIAERMKERGGHGPFGHRG